MHASYIGHEPNQSMLKLMKDIVYSSRRMCLKGSLTREFQILVFS
jgi:hypothetical protein